MVKFINGIFCGIWWNLLIEYSVEYGEIYELNIRVGMSTLAGSGDAVVLRGSWSKGKSSLIDRSQRKLQFNKQN